MGKLTKKEIAGYQKVFPPKIKVRIFPVASGGYAAEVLNFPGCVTEGETFSELIEMVNDAVATVLEIPRKYLPYLPTYLPPLKLAEKLRLAPSQKSFPKPVIDFSLV